MIIHILLSQANQNAEKGEEGIKIVNNVLKSYGWNLEDSIHCCGTNNPKLTISDELSLRAFKAGENLIG